MKTAIALFVLLLSAQAWGADDIGLTKAEIMYEDSTGFYVISFQYDMNVMMVPAVRGATVHYDALITVWQLVDGKRQRIGKDFVGYYTGGRCYEDDPAYLVKKAKSGGDVDLRRELREREKR